MNQHFPAHAVHDVCLYLKVTEMNSHHAKWMTFPLFFLLSYWEGKKRRKTNHRAYNNMYSTHDKYD